MAVHVAEIYAGLIAQRRLLFAALREAPAARLAQDLELDHRSVLGTLAHLAHAERNTVQHTLQGRPALTSEAFQVAYLNVPLTLAGVERGWGRVAGELRDFIRLEKPYDLVFPRRDLGAGGAGGTPEQVLWGVVLHEMAHLGELVAVRRRLGIVLPELAPVDHLRRNPELGRWWMAEQY